MKTSAAQAQPAPVNTIAPAPSGAGADILVLTEDDFFLLEVRKVVTLPNRVWHATSDSQAADMLLSKPSSVVLIDLALVPQLQLEAVMRRLREQLPELGFVVAGEREDRARVAKFVDREDVQGFIVKADTPVKLAALLETAINHHLELKSAAEESDQPTGRGRMPLIASGVAILLIAGGAAAWFMTRSHAPDATEADTSSLASTNGQSSALGVVEMELQKARDAFDAGRYIDNKGNGALDHYRAALAADAQNGEARDGVHRVAEVMLARAEAALLEEKPREATAALKQAKAIEPNHPRIAFLESQVARDLDRSAAAAQESQRADANSQKLASLIKQGSDRLAQDRLTDPANDSAKFYLLAARELDPNSVLAQQSLRSLGNRMLQKSGQALARNDLDGAEQWLTQAKQLGVSGLETAKAERDLRSARNNKSGEADRLLGLARDRLNSGQLIEPESDSARYYLAAVKQQYPDNPGLLPALDSLKAQLLTGAEDAAKRQEVGKAQRMLDEAKNLGAAGATYESAAAAVTTAKRRADFLAKPAAVHDDMIVRKVNPEYPPRSLRKQEQGYVDLNFTATKEGDVTDIVVVGSDPQGSFEDSAVRAIKKWKFKPKEVDGVLYEQRLGLRLRFTLQD